MNDLNVFPRTLPLRRVPGHIRVLDLDNCLVDDAWRMALIDWRAEDSHVRYARYHAASARDAERIANADLLSPDALHLIITGRPEEHRASTVYWLGRAWPREMRAGGVHVLMRPRASRQPSAELKRGLLVQWLMEESLPVDSIELAADDRADILMAYAKLGVKTTLQRSVHSLDAYTRPEPVAPPPARAPASDHSIHIGRRSSTPRPRAVQILEQMAATCRERSAVYGDNLAPVHKLVLALFPQGVPPELTQLPQWHLLELTLMKLARYAHSGLVHADSIHDAGVYCALTQAAMEDHTRAQS